MKIFSDAMCWLAARFLVWWWKRERHPVRRGERKQTIAQARGVQIYSLKDWSKRS